MTGWLLLIGLALLASALLLLSGYPRRLWTVAATAIMLAAAGYVWQGHPGLIGHPVTREQPKVEADPQLIALRNAMFDNFAFGNQDFGAADALMRANAPDEAAAVMLAGTKRAPNDAALWTWLGLMLADRDGGVVSPSSRFAFERALALAPKHPGPAYFAGFALVRAGQLPEGRAYWVQALALTPPAQPYRAAIAEQLERLDAYLRAQGTQVPATTP